MKMKLMVVFGLMALMVSGASLQADFIQCLGDLCNGTLLADIMNGSNLYDDINGNDNDDVIFGNDGPDQISGENGNDLVFAGLGSDFVGGNEGNDLLFAGPDDGVYQQRISGAEQDDAMFTFASETSTCLYLGGDEGQDTVNLIGFGPYSAHHPFGQTGDWGQGFIVEMDPIAGGYVLIFVSAEGETETVHGLTSPTPTIIGINDPIAINCPDPHPDISL